MKRRYQIDQQRAVQQFRQLAREENPNIQMIFPMAEVVGLLQEGVGHLLREAGLALMNLVMEEEVRHLAGDNESLAYKPCSAPVPIFRHSSAIRISAFRQSPHHVPT
jgi:hypothetical protein